ncbi:hypothetical protein BCD91_003055 [Clostridium beijerinckii]|uniref:hypothetical protein n=1 Tax=Clostridium beijerinckii TaxID=1520 RepID=UPI0014945854|nr:hypothetical protein [Clostridium beijerinckii]NOW91032.1 hypothetical protein [Clostridium beijerinckii]
MSKRKIAVVNSDKSCIFRITIEIISLALCMLFLIYLYIKTQSDYKSSGFIVLSSQSELAFFIAISFFCFILVFACIVALRGLLLKKWYSDKKLESLILSACVAVFLICIIIFSCGYRIIFSKDEIIYKDFSSKTYKWSDVTQITTYATRMAGGAKSSPYLYGSYNLYFNDGTKINLWDRDEGFIEHYKEIENIVKEHKINVYKYPIDQDAIDFIKGEYGKEQEKIIFQIVNKG